MRLVIAFENEQRRPKNAMIHVRPRATFAADLTLRLVAPIGKALAPAMTHGTELCVVFEQHRQKVGQNTFRLTLCNIEARCIVRLRFRWQLPCEQVFRGPRGQLVVRGARAKDKRVECMFHDGERMCRIRCVEPVLQRGERVVPPPPAAVSIDRSGGCGKRVLQDFNE